jgi:hypothetical protein
MGKMGGGKYSPQRFGDQPSVLRSSLGAPRLHNTAASFVLKT